MTTHPLLSPFGQASATPSPAALMMQRIASDFRSGLDVNLGVGYVGDELIAQEAILAAADRVRAQFSPQALLDYGGPEGDAELVDALWDYLRSRRAAPVPAAARTSHRLIVGASGATSFLAALANVLQPGLVAVADPHYYIFGDLLRRRGFELLPVVEDGQGMSASALQEAVGNRASELSFIYAVGIGNPSCQVLSTRRRQELVETAQRLSREAARPIPLVIDTAYEPLLHGESTTPPGSAFDFDEDGLVLELGSLSKLFAPSLRIGYALGRPGPLLAALRQQTSDVGFSAPLFLQRLTTELLRHDRDAQETRVLATLRRKAQATGQALLAALGDELESLSGGDAGFYYYATLKELGCGANSPLLRACLRQSGDPAWDGDPTAPPPRVMLLPGEICIGPGGFDAQRAARSFRISYASEPQPQILQGLEVLAAARARG